MSDGSNLGVTAGRALRTILSGDPAPTEAEMSAPDAAEQRVRATPLPGDGPPIHERGLDDDAAYSLVADTLAHAFIVLEEEDPGVLGRVLSYGDAPDSFTDPNRAWWNENLKGRPQDANSAVWEAFLARWPNGSEWVGGASGFQVGFAYNLACVIKGEPLALNPAIVTMGSSDETEGAE